MVGIGGSWELGLWVVFVAFGFFRMSVFGCPVCGGSCMEFGSTLLIIVCAWVFGLVKVVVVVGGLHLVVSGFELFLCVCM